MTKEKVILFYDGDCSLCNHVIRFVLSHEKETEDPLFFCSLQSDTARQILSPRQYDFKNTNSIALLQHHTVFYQSTAALKISTYLKFPYSCLIFLKIIPPFLRDICYRFIASRRKKIIKKDFCFSPTPLLQKRFLP
ncbi:MAG: DUF393 domain-containing protein [Bacteroidetes bacterium]|nr:DUF393 domain-containing protein [Bacteroidota bacterium]